jgi:hypothetical protein
MTKSTRTPRAAKSSGLTRLSPRDTLYPLNVVYRRAGIAMPAWEIVAPDQIPSPYRSLLVHDDDMTSTLERHYGGRVVLRALSTFFNGPWYFRRVLLVQEYTGRPAEMGAIRIKLDAFGSRMKAAILKNETPLGRVLADGRFDYRSRVNDYLAITPNPEMMGVFWMREPLTLYGRRTEIVHAGRKIGDIVEVLPQV